MTEIELVQVMFCSFLIMLIAYWLGKQVGHWERSQELKR